MRCSQEELHIVLEKKGLRSCIIMALVLGTSWFWTTVVA